MTSKVLGWQGFSLMKFCQCQNLNSLFREISFLELLKYPWNLQMVSMIEKFKNWKILLKNRIYLVGWQVIMRNWYAFGTLACEHVDHAAMHGTYRPRFSKLPYALWPWKLQLTFMIWRTYITSWSKRSLSRCVLLDHILWVGDW